MSDDFSNLDLNSLIDPSDGGVPDGIIQTIPPARVVGRGTSAPPLTNTTSGQDVGRGDGLRPTVLALVTEEEYEHAIVQIKNYEEYKHEFPQFKVRAGRYLSYSCDLIKAIKAKRSFPGVRYLNMAKQQELYDKAQHHFDDLIATLRKIERIEKEVHAEDVRSTVWVIRTAWYAVTIIMLVAFLKEMSHGVLVSAGIVFDDSFTQITNWLFSTLGY